MIYLDFEYNNTKEKILNIVCMCAFDDISGESFKFWTHKKSKEEIKKFILSFKDSIFFAHNVVAEASSFYSLGLDPREFKWICSFLEYRCLSNNNDSLKYGEQYKDGKVIKTNKLPPKWRRAEGETQGGYKQTHSLSETLFKLCQVQIDSERKDKMRDLIISSPKDFTQEEQEEILKYCASDIEYLPELKDKIFEKYKELLGPKYDEKQILEEMLLRGRYAAHTAVMEREGYPINVEATRNFSDSVADILEAVQRDINSRFPGTFRWKRPERKFSWNQIQTKDWISKNCPVDLWMKTDKDDISLSLEAWEKFFPFKHEYPADNFGAQIVRYLKIKQSLNGFMPKNEKSKTRSFWDYVGKDGRVRPYMNIYGAQSSRSQPAAGGFLFLKPSWMRSLCEPEDGKIIGAADYSQEEFFIQALKSEDMNMIQGYLSGDIYFHFAKLAKAVPMDGKKEDYKKIRNLFKGTTLALSFLMTKVGLARKLTQDTGEEVTEDQAQEFIDLFYSSFPALGEYQQKLIDEYGYGIPIKLECGWYMWCDSDNFRSSTNAPIQGLGASIMRKAVDLCYERGLKVIFTLHDALYIEFDRGDWHKMDILNECMKEAFVFYFKGKMKEYAKNIRLDPYMWGKGLKQDGEIITPKGEHIHTYETYIDDRAGDEYKKFSVYFKKNSGMDIL